MDAKKPQARERRRSEFFLPRRPRTSGNLGHTRRRSPNVVARGGTRDTCIAGLRGSGDRIDFSESRNARGLAGPILRLARYGPRDQGDPFPVVVDRGDRSTYLGERKRQGIERLPTALRFAAPGLRVGSGRRGGAIANLA